jgi:hypothetical protein
MKKLSESEFTELLNLQNKKEIRLYLEKDQLTFAIFGCAIKVHNALGNGVQDYIGQIVYKIKKQI